VSVTCQAAREKTIRGFFGERCGKPATERDALGRLVCAECFAFGEALRKNANDLGSAIGELLKTRRASKK